MEKYVPAHIPADAAVHWNRIFQANGGVCLDFGGDRHPLSFQPANGDWTGGYGLWISVGDAVFALECRVADTFLNTLLQNDFSAGDYFDLPDEIKSAIIEAQFEEQLDRLQSWSGLSVKIGHAPPVKDGNRGFMMAFEAGGVDGPLLAEGRVFMDEPAFLLLSAMMAKVPAALPEIHAAVPVTAHWVAGECALTIADLEGLEPLDIILADEYWGGDGRRLLLRFPEGTEYWTTMEDDRVTVEEQRVEAAAGGENAGGVESLPVVLKFEVGEKRLTVGELSALKPGYALQLDAPPDALVTIRANGLKIGTGELVSIDDRIGVRVLEVFQNATSRTA